jgi:catechol 2,3-dioxygenase-like lactoylglutathione lyase family enzyme
MSAGISIGKVGHVVLKVKSLDRALDFYCGVLGLKEVARRDFGNGPMAFLSAGTTHHDVALVEIGDRATAAPRPRWAFITSR